MKCKDCECHDFLESKGLGFTGDYRDRGHWCMHKIIVQYPHGGTAGFKEDRHMTYKEFIKTPEWCPKLLKTLEIKGIKYPIIEIKTSLNER